MTDKDNLILENLYSSFVLESKSLYAWMDSGGHVIPNESGEGHYQAAKKILKHKYNVPVNKIIFAGDAYNQLFVKGWMRLAYVGSDLFVQNNFQRPSQKQTKELKDLAIENNMSKIIYDNDAEDYHILWTSKDIL